MLMVRRSWYVDPDGTSILVRRSWYVDPAGIFYAPGVTRVPFFLVLLSWYLGAYWLLDTRITARGPGEPLIYSSYPDNIFRLFSLRAGSVLLLDRAVFARWCF